ncbi:MAG: hypothetical protein ACLT98_05335 [Eggerthellaceae bacterium]
MAREQLTMILILLVAAVLSALLGMGRSRHHLRIVVVNGHRHRAGAGAVLARSAKIDERARGARRPRGVGWWCPRDPVLATSS